MPLFLFSGNFCLQTSEIPKISRIEKASPLNARILVGVYGGGRARLFSMAAGVRRRRLAAVGASGGSVG